MIGKEIRKRMELLLAATNSSLQASSSITPPTDWSFFTFLADIGIIVAILVEAYLVFLLTSGLNATQGLRPITKKS